MPMINIGKHLEAALPLESPSKHKTTNLINFQYNRCSVARRLSNQQPVRIPMRAREPYFLVVQLIRILKDSKSLKQAINCHVQL